MPKEINRKQLNYMQAVIKYYDDGSEILQSYSTNVVKKTPDGKYIRLWDGWSSATMKQVKAYCGHYFRGLPFADGTYENLTREPQRRGYSMNGRLRANTTSYWKSRGLDYITDAIHDKNIKYLVNAYNTACSKELRETFKNNDKISRLLAALKICAINKYSSPDTTLREESKYKDLAMAAKLYKYDFDKLWLDGGLYKEYKNWIMQDEYDPINYGVLL